MLVSSFDLSFRSKREHHACMAGRFGGQKNGKARVFSLKGEKGKGYMKEKLGSFLTDLYPVPFVIFLFVHSLPHWFIVVFCPFCIPRFRFS